jgi:hypothetical protein
MAKRKRRRAKKVPTYETLYIQVEDCQPSYSFAVNNFRPRRALLGAPRIGKGRRVTAVFLGRREHEAMLEQPPNSDWKLLGVGMSSLRGDRTDFLGSLSNDAL